MIMTKKVRKEGNGDATKISKMEKGTYTYL
jgi:hypothetical protein